MKIPSSKFKEFAIEYCKLFDKDGLRPDQFGDRGSEYRNLVGVPGGKNSEFAKLLVDASVATGDKLDFAVGKGDDKDVPKVSFIMDSKDFPFYVGEQYHQVRFSYLVSVKCSCWAVLDITQQVNLLILVCTMNMHLIQFHDGFKFGEDYPKSYNSLAAKYGKREDFGTCPNGMVGIGIGGL